MFATAATKIVPVDSQGKPIYIPEDVLHQIKENALLTKNIIYNYIINKLYLL